MRMLNANAYRSIMNTVPRVGGPGPYGAAAMGSPNLCNVSNVGTPRLTLAGFPQKCLAGCATDTLSTTIPMTSTLVGVGISDSSATAISVANLRVGNFLVFANGEWIPGDAFTAKDQDEQLIIGLSVTANTPTTMQVKNDTKGQITVKAWLKLFACDPCAA